jgi:putative nucleotidyltransferase with HDIG domain
MMAKSNRTINRVEKTRPAKRAKSLRQAERDTLPGGKNPKADGQGLGAEAKRWYILLALSVTISILLFPNVLTRPRVYQLGDVADRDIKASREFLVENRELTESAREKAVRSVLSVYDFDPGAANAVSRIKEAFKAARENLASSPSSADADKVKAGRGSEDTSSDQTTNQEVSRTHFFEILDIPSDDEVFETLKTTGFPVTAENATIRLVTQVLFKGVVSNKMMLMSETGKGIILHDIQTERESEVTDLDRFYDLEAARGYVKDQYEALRETMKPQILAWASIKLASGLVKPNLTLNKRETELRKDRARKSVTPFYSKVKKGEMLVREGERITPEHLLKLSEEYKLLERREMLGKAPAMMVLMGFLLFAMYLAGLMNHRSSRAEVKDLLFSALTVLAVFLMVIASNFVAEETARGFSFFSARALLFAAPVAGGAMLISIFQGMGVAASFSLIVSVLASLAVGGRVEFFMYFFVSSLVAAYGVRNCRQRGIFIKTGLTVGVSNMVIALAIEALYGAIYSPEAIVASAAAFVGGVLVGVVATGILPLVEMAFGYASDIKLLELANLDQALLRQLMVQSPGTYHHSVIVSNMVEATAEAVNANPLLAKVAAYYHDIGKTKKPLYFIENQLSRENKHGKLAPSMSALILISHVKDGVELAKGHKLGKEIIDIIRQHHGTSLITYFYEKAKEQVEKKGRKSPQAKEDDFRYPGPKPQTKEAGLIMLADVVEAASRTLVDPTAARIQGMVQKIINRVFSDGQLDECELTLKDLHRIAKGFNTTLSGIFHHRIEYPEGVEKGSGARFRDRSSEGSGVFRKGENGYPDQVAAEDSRAKRSEDKTEAEESLRRLGLS